MKKKKKPKNLNFPFSKSFDWKQKKAPKNFGAFLMLSYLDLLLLLCKILSKVGQNHFGSCSLDRKQHLIHAAVVV